MTLENNFTEKPKILYVTRLNEGSTGFGYLNGFRSLGLSVEEVDTSTWLGKRTFSLIERVALKIRRGRLPNNTILELNRAIISAADKLKPDLTFFVGASFILPETLQYTKRFGLNFVHFQDDMFNPACQTYTFFEDLPYWDCILTTKSYNVEEFQALGVSQVVFVRKAYTPGLHYIVQPSTEEYEKYKGDVIFVGNLHYPSRADFLAEIIYRCPEVKFNIWGFGWKKPKRPHYWLKPRRWSTWPSLIKASHNYPLWYEDMSKAMNSNKIALGLLNHHNRDQHTHRTVEIPACGAFMLMERTSENLDMFEEGVEAEYFGTMDELIHKIKYYLSHDEERQAIAKAGHERCLISDYSYDDRAKTAIEHYEALIQDIGEMKSPGYCRALSISRRVV